MQEQIQWLEDTLYSNPANLLRGWHNPSERKRIINKSNERKQKLKKIIETYGFWSFTGDQLAEQIGVSPQRISQYMKELKQELATPDVQEIKANYLAAFKTQLARCQRLTLDGSKKEQLEAMRTFAMLTEKLDGFLERHALKEKVPDKLIHGGVVVNVDVRSALALLEDEEKKNE